MERGGARVGEHGSIQRAHRVLGDQRRGALRVRRAPETHEKRVQLKKKLEIDPWGAKQCIAKHTE